MGRRHLAALAAADIEVAAVCDTSETARAAVLRGEARAARAYERWQDLIGREAVGIDLLTIATNGPSHHEIALAAAKSGIRHLVCEKPMATSGRKAREMAAECRARGTRLAVNLSRRFAERFHRLKALIAGGTIGAVKHINVSVGAGGLGCIGTHYFDLVAWLTDSSARWLVGEIERNPAPNIRGVQFFDPGGRGFAGYSNGMTVCYQFCEEVAITPVTHIIGTDGYVETLNWVPGGGRVIAYARPEHSRQLLKTRHVTPVQIPFDAGEPMDVVRATRACIEDLLGAHAEDTASAGIAAVDVVLAFHLSARAGMARVSLPLEGEALELDVPIT